MRLVIEALEETEGDLMLALAAWRDRIEGQLKAHNIRLNWSIRDPYGLPVIQELRPWHVIQLIRILDEVVTNVVKHACARTVSIVIEADNDPQSEAVMRVTVQDDGRGFDPDSAGDLYPANPASRRGLKNMRWRASECGIGLTIASSSFGTSVELRIPAQFVHGRAKRGERYEKNPSP